MVDDDQKFGIWDSVRDKEGSGLCIASPKKSGTESGVLDVSEMETHR